MTTPPKSAIQMSFNSYAMALLDVMPDVLIDKANTLIARRKANLESSFRVSLNPIKIHYDAHESKYILIYPNSQF